MVTNVGPRGVIEVDAGRVREQIEGILGRQPALGLAMGVVYDGQLAFFHGHGLADLATRASVTEHTAFRIASLTKLFTAVAVMQLRERGLVDLDTPANSYLRAYDLLPAADEHRPATLRHLLTHTAGVPEVLHLRDLFHPSWGPFGDRPAVLSVKPGEPLPSLAEYYREGLRLVAEPGTVFSYSNHGFATLGQIVEDVSGQALGSYFQDHIFEPLGMTSTVYGRPELGSAQQAIGYVVGSSGPVPVADRDWISGGASNISSTTSDMARFVAALLAGGTVEHGSILESATLATMFDPHYQPDPRLPGMGLGFFRGECAGHRVVEHSGTLPGFHTHLLAAPDAGIGFVAFTNGSADAFAWLPIELRGLLRALLGVPDEERRNSVAHHPDIWSDLCGRYRLPPGSDLRGRVALGAGVEVFVRGGRLMLRLLTPVPALLRGAPLQPGADDDPYTFRLHLPGLGMGLIHVVFAGEPGAGITAMHTDLGSQPLSFHRRSSLRGQRP
jgi:CubicO group peptidase (beta-lactamase class C family)